jgi:hypothetical protein
MNTFMFNIDTGLYLTYSTVNIMVRPRNNTVYKNLILAFWLPPRNLSNHMDRQARTRDTV